MTVAIITVSCKILVQIFVLIARSNFRNPQIAIERIEIAQIVFFELCSAEFGFCALILFYGSVLFSRSQSSVSWLKPILVPIAKTSSLVINPAS